MPRYELKNVYVSNFDIDGSGDGAESFDFVGSGGDADGSTGGDAPREELTLCYTEIKHDYAERAVQESAVLDFALVDTDDLSQTLIDDFAF